MLDAHTRKGVLQCATLDNVPLAVGIQESRSVGRGIYCTDTVVVYGGFKMADLCTDNRFELIEKYKKKLIEATNIEDAQDEMNVLGDILFRFWQMGWLDRLEMTPRIEMLQDDTLMIEADEGQFEKVGRIILSYKTWCKIFYQDEGEEDE